jgi:ferritin
MLTALAAANGAPGRLGYASVAAGAFIDKLNEQIAHEFAASQQYVAVAVHYDGETLPRLADFFYRQAVEERNHAMMMVQYLLDAGEQPRIPGVEPPRTEFADVVEPVHVALDQERRVSAQIGALAHVKRVSEQIGELASIARAENDYASEQFMQWFIKEQVEEVSTMSALLAVAERLRDKPMDIEEYLARERGGGEAADPTAPPAAGGAL